MFTYSLTRRQRVESFAVSCTLLVLCLVSLPLGGAEPLGLAWGRPAAWAGAVLLALVTVLDQRRRCVVVDEAGVTSQGLLRSRHLPWSVVRAIEVRRTALGEQQLVAVADDRSMALAAPYLTAFNSRAARAEFARTAAQLQEHVPRPLAAA